MREWILMPGRSAMIKSLIRSLRTWMSFVILPSILFITPLYSQQSPRTQTSRQGAQRQRRTFPPRTLEPPRTPGPERPENRPFKTYDTRPVVLYGPFILDVSDKSATIEWVTDTPCIAKVKYGENTLLNESEPEEKGLVPVGTLHRIELTGLSPGHTYQYQTVSTRVVRLKPYWPDMGLSTESAVYTFTTLDTMKPSASFSVITDTHEDVLA